MATFSVVAHIDVFEDVRGNGFSGWIDLAAEALELKQLVVTLGECAVTVGASSTHAAEMVVSAQDGRSFIAGK